MSEFKGYMMIVGAALFSILIPHSLFFSGLRAIVPSWERVLQPADPIPEREDGS